MQLDYSPELLQQLQQEEAYRNVIGSVAAQVLPYYLKECSLMHHAINCSIECAKQFVESLDEVKP